MERLANSSPVLTRRIDNSLQRIATTLVGEYEGEHPFFEARAIRIEGKFEQHLVPALFEGEWRGRTSRKVFILQQIFVAHGSFPCILPSGSQDFRIVEPNPCAHSVPMSVVGAKSFSERP